MEKNIDKVLKELKDGTIDFLPEKELKEKLEKAIKNNKPLRIKFGADPSSKDLHLGHAVCLNKLRKFQEFGHHVDLVIGDFTARIGDPTGKSKTRKMLTEEQVIENAKTYTEQAFKILDREKTTIHFNNDWLNKLRFSDIIELSSKYTVARLLERDDFSKRFKSNTPISVLEFLYPLAQGYDSVHLKSDIEIGGSDQKFNFLVARHLQVEYGVEPQCIITLPLLVGTDGVNKMSKSLKNDIPIMADPNDMFGKVLSIPDSVMVDYFRYTTSLSADEVKEIEQGLENGTLHPMETKKRLAQEIVTTYYDKETALKARAEFEKVFSKKELPTEIPEFEVENKENLLINIVLDAKMVSSKGEAKRLIKSGGIKLNGNKVTEPLLAITPENGMIIQVGKRKFIKLVIK